MCWSSAGSRPRSSTTLPWILCWNNQDLYVCMNIWNICVFYNLNLRWIMLALCLKNHVAKVSRCGPNLHRPGLSILPWEGDAYNSTHANMYGCMYVCRYENVPAYVYTWRLFCNPYIYSIWNCRVMSSFWSVRRRPRTPSTAKIRRSPRICVGSLLDLMPRESRLVVAVVVATYSMCPLFL